MPLARHASDPVNQETRPLDLRNGSGEWLGVVDAVPVADDVLRLPLHDPHVEEQTEASTTAQVIELRLAEWIDDTDGKIVPTWRIDDEPESLERVAAVYVKGSMCKTKYGEFCDYIEAIEQVSALAKFFELNPRKATRH